MKIKLFITLIVGASIASVCFAQAQQADTARAFKLLLIQGGDLVLNEVQQGDDIKLCYKNKSWLRKNAKGIVDSITSKGVYFKTRFVGKETIVSFRPRISSLNRKLLTCSAIGAVALLTWLPITSAIATGPIRAEGFVFASLASSYIGSVLLLGTCYYGIKTGYKNLEFMASNKRTKNRQYKIMHLPKTINDDLKVFKRYKIVPSK